MTAEQFNLLVKSAVILGLVFVHAISADLCFWVAVALVFFCEFSLEPGND